MAGFESYEGNDKDSSLEEPPAHPISLQNEAWDGAVVRVGETKKDEDDQDDGVDNNED
eukprot:CAMPEP_0172499002 /NCGR_PEP_ID=MMETSP1066-20121228/120946_1 /TAXON_ID=671091 /ORGANISM="Coscinodiscus wailesii, Strain CCMP2513" /LENGTH=57 /DNA_ID=CAMNT_0013272529 /DNA_START=521 /DNA_END=694 /DNA_ORIENTATION=+